MKDRKSQIQVYPNPTSDWITIEGLEDIQTIRIYTMQGKLMKKISMPKNKNIDVSELPKGQYILQANQYSTRFLKR